jgi:hypothetical protein
MSPLLFFVLSFLGWMLLSSQSCAQDEDNLLALRAIWKGFNNQPSSWTGNNYSSWEGISLDIYNTYVISIKLPYYNLSGILDPAVGKLSSLEELDLTSNEIAGPIPAELSKISGLHFLRLGKNNFNGSIPHGLISNHSLVIDLSFNNLEGPLTIQTSLPLLKSLSLANNHLSGAIPDEIWAPNLVVLDLKSNNFSGLLSPKLSNSANLTFLRLTDNVLLDSSTLSSISLPITLNYLMISSTSMNSNFPSSIWKLFNLVYLALNNANISGPVPDMFSNLPRLQNLYIRSNNLLSGPLPSSIGLLDGLIALDISDTQITNVDVVANCKALNLLEARNTKLLSLPDLSNLTSLTSLAVSGNNFSSTSSISNLPPSLLRLFMSNCCLSCVPAAVVALSWRCGVNDCTDLTSVTSPLTVLDLSHNLDLKDLGANIDSVLNFDGVPVSIALMYQNYYEPVFDNLKTLTLDYTGIEYVPDGYLPNSIFHISFRNCSSLDLLSMINSNDSRLRLSNQSMLYFSDRSYSCKSITLASDVTWSAEHIMFDPSNYNYFYCSCFPGFFGAVPDGTSDSMCFECDSYASFGKCLDSGSFELSDNAYPNFPPDVFDSDDGQQIYSIQNVSHSLLFLHCDLEEACEARNNSKCGFLPTSGQLRCWKESHSSEQSSDLVHQEDWSCHNLTCLCNDGYENRLCSQCEDRYFFADEECKKCPSDYISYLMFALSIVVVVMVTLASEIAKKDSYEVLELISMMIIVVISVENPLVVIGYFLLVLVALVRNKHMAVAFRNFFFFSQILINLLPNEEIPFPFMKTISHALIPFPIACIFNYEFNNPAYKVLAVSLLPCAMAVFLAFVKGLLFFHTSHVERSRKKAAPLHHEDAASNSAHGQDCDSDGQVEHPASSSSDVDNTWPEGGIMSQSLNSVLDQVKPYIVPLTVLFFVHLRILHPSPGRCWLPDCSCCGIFLRR